MRRVRFVENAPPDIAQRRADGATGRVLIPWAIVEGQRRAANAASRAFNCIRFWS